MRTKRTDAAVRGQSPEDKGRKPYVQDALQGLGAAACCMLLKEVLVMRKSCHDRWSKAF